MDSVLIKIKNESWGILSLIILIVLGYIIVFIIPSYLLDLNEKFIISRLSLFRIVGWLVLPISILIWLSSIVNLRLIGKGTPHPYVKTTSVLVVAKTYKYVRHPIYFALILFFISLFLLYQNLIYIIYALYSTVLIINVIIPREENTLIRKFQNYKTYKEITYMLIPFVRTSRIKGGYWLFFVVFIMMFLIYISSRFRLTHLSDTSKFILFILGTILIGSGIVVFLWSIMIHLQPSKEGLKTDGIYRICRNPMYSGIFHIFIGIIFIFFDPISIILFPILYGFAYYYVVRIKEPKQMERWGDEFLTYKNRFRFI